MIDILSILFNHVEELPPTPEMKAISQRSEPFYERLCQLTDPQEADNIWCAALDVGCAESSVFFRRGFAMGVELCRALDKIDLTR